MKRISNELESNGGAQEGNLMLQGVRFAYTIHQVHKFTNQYDLRAMFISIWFFPNISSIQFAGGFDGETLGIFHELKKISTSETR